MPKSCAARQCCNRYSSRRKQLTFHRFPFSRPELLREWVLNIGRAGFQPKQHTVICSEHFRPDCFSAFGNRKNLKLNAVPTVFAFQEPGQLARENADPAREAGDAGSATGRVLGPGRKMDTALGALPTGTTGEPGRQALPLGPREPRSPTGLGSPAPTRPPDHSYALGDLDALKRKLFLTLRENEQLRRRLRAQRRAMQRMCSCLRARGAGPRPEPQS